MTDENQSKRVEVILDAGIDASDAVLSLVMRSAVFALDAEHTAGPDAVTVLLSDDKTLRDLNRRFNGEDTVTDVLSFNDVEGWHNGVPPPDINDAPFLAPGEQQRLGEIVISLEQTKRQADERSIKFERELALLTIHGVLHLLGYDHAEPDEERIMFSKTDAVLERVFRESAR